MSLTGLITGLLTGISGRTFLASASILTGGTIGAQMIGFLALPIIAVLYGPSAYGQFAVVQAIAGILAASTLLRYEMALMQAEKDRDAALLARLAIAVSLGLIGVVALILLAFWSALTPALGLAELGVWWLPLTVVTAGLTALSTVMTAALIRRHRTMHIAGSRIVQSLVGVAIQIAVGLWFDANALGLVGGLVVGQALACLLLWAGGRRSPAVRKAEVFGADGGQIAMADYVDLARRFSGFPRHAASTVILNTASQQLLPIAISSFFGPALAGAVALSQRLTQFPVMLITAQIWQLVFARLRGMEMAARRVLLRKVHVAASFGWALPMAIVAVNAEALIGLLGERWSVVRPEYLAVFCLLAWMNGTSNATSYFSAFHLFREESIMNLALFGVRLLSVVVPAMFGSVGLTLYIYATSATVFFFLVIVYWAQKLLGLGFALVVLSAAFVGSLSTAFVLRYQFTLGNRQLGIALLLLVGAIAVWIWRARKKINGFVNGCAAHQSQNQAK